MARIMALDYGNKRCGLATTDPFQIIASPLDAVETPTLFAFFERYFKQETAECLVVGLASMKDGKPSSLEPNIQKFIKKFKAIYPNIRIERQEERYSSQRAKEVIFQTRKKKQRREKGLVDQISAAIILQEFMGFL